MNHASRQTAVAGTFYPANPKELETQVSKLLSDSQKEFLKCPKALIAPHAGYIYSGPIAANAYHGISKFKDQIKQVVIFGPSHHMAFEGIAATHAPSYQTPLGEIKIVQALAQKLKPFKQIGFYDPAHLKEHSIEVHLPFLIKVLDHFEFVPLVVGQSQPEYVAEVMGAFWNLPGTLIIVSTDLSHYHTYDEAKNRDLKTSDQIENLDYTQISPDQACGARPLNGLLKLIKDKSATIERLDLRNSGDTAGPRDQVVGYAAYAVYE